MTKWTDFMKGKMSKYMKSEGSHSKAIKRLSKEYKKKFNSKRRLKKH